jgi:hypothetical protein
MNGERRPCEWPGGVAGWLLVGRRATAVVPCLRRAVETNRWRSPGSDAPGVDFGAVDALLRV